MLANDIEDILALKIPPARTGKEHSKQQFQALSATWLGDAKKYQDLIMITGSEFEEDQAPAYRESLRGYAEECNNLAREKERKISQYLALMSMSKHLSNRVWA